MIEYSPTVAGLSISIKNISLRMGYNFEEIPIQYKLTLEELFDEALKVVKPKCGFTVVSPALCKPKEGKILIDTIEFQTDKIIAHSLKDISEAALFVGTVGTELSVWMKEKQKQNDFLVEYVVDLIGSEIAESIAKWMHNKIISEIEDRGMQCSNRYSPGYCGWDVKEQSKLFSYFPKNYCNISLTESALMNPIKSVSGIVGIGENICYEDYPCETCRVQYCYKNRK